ncbi:uncharacterized protein LOC101848813 [Aplysia californica]|uniref:Uncharacterized protein LOC101848813 n=1 Tax=Aplysia californica TaxID=6500 RepID=A0ABM0JM43_APLCA|nr:uncharacterized protein LOC101848813 [Aplysia californica]
MTAAPRVAWKDKKAKTPVVVVSTHATAHHMEEHQTSRGRLAHKPSVVHSDNDNMNGCDSVDQNAGYNSVFERKTYKWRKKLFHWKVELVQLNALVLYNETRQQRVSLITLKKMLISELVNQAVDMMQQKQGSCHGLPTKKEVSRKNS